MEVDFSRIETILFDLGDVIINIDPERTYMAFAELAGKDIESLKTSFLELQVFDRYEKGEFQDQEFVDFLRSHLPEKVTDKQVIEAWNALLLDIPQERLGLLETLASKYELYLLSNTSSIHILDINETIARQYGHTGKKDLKHFFRQVFYSYEIGMRKPDASVYQHVLQEIGQDPQKMVFLDDRKDNLEGAAQLGIQTLHVDKTNERTMTELLAHA